MKLHEGEYPFIIMAAVIKGVLSYDEYFGQYRGKYLNPDIGTDSFMAYLEAAMLGVDAYLTGNKAMKADAEELEARFGVRVV